MLNEFKTFVMKGNVLDLATGVILGGAFGKIVSSLVSDILMPPIGLMLGKVDFSSLFFNLSSTPMSSLAEAKKAGIPTINYGIFINNIFDFAIVGFCVFILIKQLTRLQKPVAAVAPPAMKDCPFCITSIAMQAKRCPNCTSSL